MKKRYDTHMIRIENIKEGDKFTEFDSSVSAQNPMFHAKSDAKKLNDNICVVEASTNDQIRVGRITFTAGQKVYVQMVK